MKTIIVASKNPVKIQAALQGFREMFPETEFEAKGISVPSGVGDQPMGKTETLLGATNRMQAAYAAVPDADYWIGIEGGNIVTEEGMEVMAWVVIQNHKQIGQARTAGFFLPARIIELVNEGYELGDADDMVFGVQNSKQSGGSSALLTDGVMTRLRFYIPAVILALIPFKKPILYK